MKVIDQKRIIQAISSIEDHLGRNGSFNQSQNIAKAFALFGVKCSMGATTDIDTGKLSLEISFNDQFLDEYILPLTSVYQACTKHFDAIDKWTKYYGRKREKVWQIQSRQEISGLEMVNAGFTELPFSDFEYPSLAENLRLIQKDYEVLRSWKPRIIETWLQFACLYKLDFYIRIRDEDDVVWSQIGLEDLDKILQEIAPLYDWAESWNDPGETFNLLLGSGHNMNDPDESVLFCAYKKGV